MNLKILINKLKKIKFNIIFFDVKKFIKYLIIFSLIIIVAIFISFEIILVNEWEEGSHNIHTEIIKFGTYLSHENSKYEMQLRNLSIGVSLTKLKNEDPYVLKTINMIKGQEASSGFNNIYYVENKSGNAINDSELILLSEIKSDLRHRIWFTEAINRHMYLTDVYTDAITGEKVVTISIPVHNNKDEFIGIIAGDILLSKFKENIKNYNFHEKLHYQIVDSEDNQIFEYNPREEYSEEISELFFYEEFLYDLMNHERYNSQIRLNNNKGSTTNWKINLTISPDYIKYLTIQNFLNYSNEFLLSYLFIILITFFYVRYQGIDKSTGLYNVNAGKVLFNKISKKDSQNIYLLYLKVKNLESLEYKNKPFFKKELLIKIANCIIKDLNLKNDPINLDFNKIINIISNQEMNNIKDNLKEIGEKYKNHQIDFWGEVFLIDVDFILVGVNKNNKTRDFKSLVKNLDDNNEYLINKSENEKNYVFFENFESIDKLIGRKKKDKEFILKAIENNEIYAFFQPIINFESNEVYKYEVLMRLKKDGEYISPFKYIKIAEQEKIIHKMDYLVIKKAIKYIKSLNKDIRLSFNLSVHELSDYNYLKTINELMLLENIDRSLITFEITETKAMENIRKYSDNMKFLKEHGFKISLDDFGTGFSNFDRIKDIDIDYIKIDGVFVKNALNNERSLLLLKGIVNFSKSLNINIIAEYVENAEIVEILKNMEVDYGQGYFYSKPLEIIKFDN